ncbi:hypothetical protein B6N60_01663 [Richelia sinica FACHB-800]|uniref:Uncharacterized protein n=1 Tax=Richelia sinica FACHB-800 TaxID=1357546 RepID=A0A975T7T0_9NOST|nr:hypothetical protein B6N60_01663 [Richelia sinica FACHB-800]
MQNIFNNLGCYGWSEGMKMPSREYSQSKIQTWYDCVSVLI